MCTLLKNKKTEINDTVVEVEDLGRSFGSSDGCLSVAKIGFLFAQ